jgi:predicted metal-dependent phosphoesterase TrpH
MEVDREVTRSGRGARTARPARQAYLQPIEGWSGLARRAKVRAMGRADLHVHTTASDGMMSPAMVLNYVSVHTDLDVLAITDHNTMAGWEQAREFAARPVNDHLAQLELAPGVEVSSRDGHIIALFVERLIPRDLSAAETIVAIHEQGGLALAAHPFAWLPGLKEFAGVGAQFVERDFDAVEVRNSTPTEFFNNWRTHRLNRRQREPKAEYGGSDAHFLWAIGRTWTEFPGRGAGDLRRAIEARTSRAGGLTWGPVSLLEYYRDRRRWRQFCAQHSVRLHDL